MTCSQLGRGCRGYHAVVHLEGRFHPKQVKVLELPGEQPGGLKASSHAAFLDQAEPALDQAVVFWPVGPPALMANGLSRCNPRERLVHELGAVVRSEAFDGVNNVGQEFRRYRRHVDRILASEGTEPSHARRVILEQDQVQNPPSRSDFPRAGKVNENALQGLGHPRGRRRPHRRTSTLRLHAPTASEQPPRELDVMLPGRLASKALVGVGVALVENVGVHLLKTSNTGDEHDSSNGRA